MALTAAYVYCLVKAPRRPSVAKRPGGLPGATAPELLTVSEGLWLVVADVPLADYGPEPLEAVLRNLEKVSQVAVAHESVIESFTRLRTATTVPMKLFTMFSTRERALADVRSRRRALAGVIKRIAGAEEWGVRVAVQPGMPAQAPGQSAAVRGGAAFLAAKKQARDTARQAVLAAADAAEGGFHALSRIARASSRRDDVPAGAVAPPLLDAAFLVPHDRRARFKAAARAAAADCRRAGATMTLTGPWPTYSFVRSPGADR